MKKNLFLTALVSAALQMNAQTVVFSQAVSGSTGIVSDAISNGSFVASADDFTLTSQNRITKIKVEGFQNAGTLETTVATGLMLYIYANDAGKPAGIPGNPLVAPIAQIDIAKDAPGYTLTKTGAEFYTFSVDLTAALASPLVLQANTVYWLVFAAKTNLPDFSSTGNTRFNWFTGVQGGNTAKLVDPGNAFGTNSTSWQDIAPLTGAAAYNGLAFSIEGQSTLGTAEIFSNVKEITVYPNPASDYLFIKTKSKINAIEIFDMSGKKLPAQLEGNKVDVKNLNSGSYIVSFETKDGKTIEKFIKK
ncbi:T9SS type A sorting domain-containing protein [Chryseobacterium sp. L7]|uniref:T9SS type A sorting domain-containing protein n=1 Tax=Chryseobacterium endalhagicum TaxID=2797638 RepID=A0ABS1QE24_9FLAO|nr:T9SS type A sorting domain-containing protein [Chryseobacterium endalhagicum]MBL1220860.1 T9SS type A sorting domain-containing protein [Chryseobacterium endalhagicum]